MSVVALEVTDVRAGYGSAAVLFGIDLSVKKGQVLALMGRNGMGKSTVIRTILGLTTLTSGRIRISGRDVTRLPTDRIARAGVGWVPEGRQIFAALTVEENLLVAARRARRNDSWTLSSVYDLFPRLADRKQNLGNQLSGGEQQMLAIGRALMTQPSVLMLDEATEGLAPLIRQEIWQTVRKLKQQGQSLLVVDRDFNALEQVVDAFSVMDKGRIAYSGTAIEFVANRVHIERTLAVGE